MSFSRVIGLLVALFATALFVVLGLVQFREKTAMHRPVVPPYDLFWCQTNNDCTVTDRIGCCACDEGGAQAAITRWRRDELAEFLAGACHEAWCHIRFGWVDSSIAEVSEGNIGDTLAGGHGDH